MKSCKPNSGRGSFARVVTGPGRKEPSGTRRAGPVPFRGVAGPGGPRCSAYWPPTRRRRSKEKEQANLGARNLDAAFEGRGSWRSHLHHGQACGNVNPCGGSNPPPRSACGGSSAVERHAHVRGFPEVVGSNPTRRINRIGRGGALPRGRDRGMRSRDGGGGGLEKRGSWTQGYSAASKEAVSFLDSAYQSTMPGSPWLWPGWTKPTSRVYDSADPAPPNDSRGKGPSASVRQRPSIQTLICSRSRPALKSTVF